MKKITMRGIAAKCSVAPCTVLRALRGGPIRQELREKILAAARESGYETGGPAHWGLLVNMDNMLFSYEAGIVQQFSMEILRRGDSFAVLPIQIPALVHKEWFDGVFCISPTPSMEEIISRVQPIPIVAVNDFSAHSQGVWTVCADDAEMTSRMVDYLVNMGHRKIAIWEHFRDTKNFSDRRRVRFFQQAMAERGLHGAVYLWDMENMNGEMERLVSDRITACFIPGESVYAADDIYPFMRRFLREQNLKIPDDLSIITLENPQDSVNASPPVTTFGQDFAQIAREALMLGDQLRSGHTDGLRNLKIKYHFHERESVAKLI